MSTTVTFPLDYLDLSSFVHSDIADRITQYELCGIVTHYGGGADSKYFL